MLFFLYPAPCAAYREPGTRTEKLLVHDLVLRVDALEVDHFHNRLEEFAFKPSCGAWAIALSRILLQRPPCSTATYSVFDAPDLLGDPHPVAEQLKQFGVDLVDLTAQTGIMELGRIGRRPPPDDTTQQRFEIRRRHLLRSVAQALARQI